jgi:hypothetical protein
MSIYDIAIDNKIKAGTIRFGEDWESFHYEPKIASDEPIVCPARGGTFFVIRQPIRLEEVERFKTHEYIIGFYELHIDFQGTENFPEIDTTQLDLTQRYLETRKGVVRFLDRLELIFTYSDEQWRALKNADEITALKNQVKALESRAQKQGLWFEIDDKATQVATSGGSKDFRRVQVNVRLRCFNDSNSKLAVREFGAGLLVARENGGTEVIGQHAALHIMSDLPKMETIKVEDGWLIEDPISPFRWYRFWFDISKDLVDLL